MDPKNFSIQEMVNKAIANENSKRVKKEQTSWHPSGLGGCLTSVYLERLGFAPIEQLDERTLRVFSVGNQMESWLTGLLKQEYPDIEQQVRIEIPEYNVTGYADLVVNFPDKTKRLYEIKTQHSKSFHWMNKRGDANQHHREQVWLYLKALNLEYGTIIYLSKDDLCIQEYGVRLDDEMLRDSVLQQLEILNKSWRDKVPPPCITNKDDWRYKYCRLHSICLDTIKNPKNYAQKRI